MELTDQIRDVLVKDVKRRLLDESMPRIRKCLDELNDKEIWYRPNDNTVSVGNLLLHLNGNVRQWILSSIGEHADTRNRDSEFLANNITSGDALFSLLENTMAEIVPVLDNLSSEDLIKVITVQGFSETVIAILIHVTEHFSYHVGQITYFVKTRKNIDMGYYNGLDLSKK
ncbi:DinB family protein [Bacteroidota bacterium]